MNIQTVVALIILILLIPYIKKAMDRSLGGSAEDGNFETVSEMEQRFLEKLRAESRPVRIAYVYEQIDVMMIKSLLQSEQIPYLFEFENMSSLRLGLPFSDHNKTILNVLAEDYEDAVAVLTEYRARKSSIEGNEDAIQDESNRDGPSRSSAEDSSVEIIGKDEGA